MVVCSFYSDPKILQATSVADKGEHMIRLVFISLVAISMYGCVTVPKSSTELVETSGTTQEYCYSLSPEEAGIRVEALLSNCYGPVETVIPIGGLYVPMSADFQVVNEQLPDGNRYSVRNFVGFGYSANVIDGGEDCRTRIQMYAVTGLWKNAFTAVDLAVKEQEYDCP